MASYDTIPKGAKLQPTKYNVSISEEKLQQMKQLITLSPIGPETYENLQESRDLLDFGISRKWLSNMKAEWEKYDWRAAEAHINSFPNFTLPVKDDDRTYTIHFAALFSTNPSAIPIAFFHGWPGSFLEFLPMLELLKKKYPSPDKLPYHIIVPSLPGYAFSDRPPKDHEWTGPDSARLMHKLLEALGFGETGYAVQGGDVGSYIARSMATKYDACKAIHLNFSPVLAKPDDVPESDVNEEERKALARGEAFRSSGMAYVMEHSTRPSTIGLVLSASPIALLGWIGEKFLSWADTPPSTAAILESVSLYWLTETFPTSIYTYRHDNAPRAKVNFHAAAENHIGNKPFGYSFFPKEIVPTPHAWVATTGDLVWHRQHSSGGHFAAMESTEALWGDVEDFVAKMWKK